MLLYSTLNNIIKHKGNHAKWVLHNWTIKLLQISYSYLKHKR